jgi:hypothetical protein
LALWAFLGCTGVCVIGIIGTIGRDKLVSIIDKKIGTTVGKLGKRVANIVGEKFGKTALRSVMKKSATEIGEKALVKVAKTSLTKASEKVAGKLAVRSFEKLSIKGMQRLGLQLGKNILKTSATMTAKLGTKLATEVTTMGPLAAGMLMFDIMSMGLDLGDAGGYLKMGTNKMYKEMKSQLDTETQKIYAENNTPFPTIIGPLDKLSADSCKNQQSYIDYINKEAQNDMNTDMAQYVKDRLTDFAKQVGIAEENIDDYIADKLTKPNDAVMQTITNEMTNKKINDINTYKQRVSAIYLLR